MFQSNIAIYVSTFSFIFTLITRFGQLTIIRSSFKKNLVCTDDLICFVKLT